MNGLLAPQRWFFDGHLPLIEGELRPRFVPDGLELRPYEARWMEEVRQAHNLAFRTRYGALDVGRSAWTASLTRPEFRPEWSWLAVCADAPDAGVVGYALNSEICDTETGWREGPNASGCCRTFNIAGWAGLYWFRPCIPSRLPVALSPG